MDLSNTFRSGGAVSSSGPQVFAMESPRTENEGEPEGEPVLEASNTEAGGKSSKGMSSVFADGDLNSNWSKLPNLL